MASRNPLSNRDAACASDSAPDPAETQLRRVLLVEDELDIQTVARMALEDLGGLRVEVCDSGEEALLHGPAFRPQLVLLDYMMPGMNGRKTLEAFAEVPTLATVPIVFLTARAQLDEVAEYHRLGAVDVIIKPFDPMSLAEQVQTVWRRHVGSIE